ncbi:MAG TPA: LON peptidase substrate-binding domain-containing protein, partial [Enhygromyxa sp.]|nr:LON peptidase substrate-binding domain-containing protein [Enhygromyxa sp.]
MTELKANEYPLLPLRRGVLLPGSVSTLPVGRARSLALVQAVSAGAIIAVASQREPETEHPTLTDLHPIAVLAKVHRVGRSNDGSARLVVETLERVHLTELLQSEPYIRVAATPAPDRNADTTETRILAESLREHVRELAGDAGGNLVEAVAKNLSPSRLADTVGGHLPLERHAEIEVLMTVDVAERLRLVARLVNEAREVHEIRQKIDEEVRKRLGKQQRDVILRERMKAIQTELGEEDEGGELDKLEARLAEAELPEEIQQVAERELRRLAKLNPAHPEFSVARTYLETIADLPWSKRAEVRDDLDAVAAQLDADH